MVDPFGLEIPDFKADKFELPLMTGDNYNRPAAFLSSLLSERGAELMRLEYVLVGDSCVLTAFNRQIIGTNVFKKGNVLGLSCDEGLER